ncbi:non-ribosomal peptide synthetase [Candidatus Megaera polyxenophila]|nr:non-ribosomal peptide synthetase [Candidatus Megaera polyxenophila]
MINKFNIQDLYPLSPIQSGFLFQHLYAPQSDAYFVQSIFLIDGVIETSNFKIAWQKIIDTYSILRTGFVWQNLEMPFQYVLKTIKSEFNLLDWQDFSDIEQEERLKDFIEQDRKKGFDLNNVPLIRIHLIQKNSNSYYLVWSNHHILLDGWSSSTIFHNFLKLYRALNINQEFLIKEDKPYRDYIAWLQKQDLTRAEQFWKQYLSSLEEPTYLSFQHLIKEKQNQDYSIYSEVLSLDETKRIKNFAQKHGLTLNTILQGAVAIVVQHYLQQKEIVLGLTVSGRNINLTGIEDMVGLFINTLPLRVQFEENNIISFLKKLQNDTQKINDYTYTQLADIQKWIKFNQSLFNVIFIFENYLINSEKITNLNIKDIQSIERTEYPLTIVMSKEKELHIVLTYQTSHFNQEIIIRLSDHIKLVLFQIVTEQNIILLTQEEERKILSFNTKVLYPQCFIYQLFERVVKNSLKETAVRCGDKELTYDQLNKISNKIGWYLVNKGVKSEESVAIIMERSVEMIAAIIGVLKAGGCYVPIEPNCPGDRLKFILEDAQVGIVLTQNSLIDKFISYNGEIITSDSYLFYEEKDHNLSTIMYADNLAYIIYTSGSTGTPKGVMGTHENLVQSLISRTNYYKEDKIRSLLVVPVSFDSSITAIFWPLITGGSVTIVPQIEYLDLEQLLYIIKNNSISHFPCPPALYLSLLETGSSKLKNLQVVVVAGERCPERILELHFELLSNTLLSNEYGPTEVSVWSSASSIYDNERKYKVDKITIGKQRTNVELFILDEKIRILPIGVKGEIYIGGKGLARGYINRADLTAERFIANPFGNGERLYKTGDIGRYLYDGNIEYLGRSDEQVKIRGYRIELGEIEEVLNKHVYINTAIVITSKTNYEELNLVAYVVLKEIAGKYSQVLLDSLGKEFHVLVIKEKITKKLKSTLALMLPEYMIPRYFIYLDRIPLTNNGKIDKKALPEAKPKKKNKNYIAPRNQLEKELCKIWEEILHVEKVGINDNFFTLGGHSIVATKLVIRIHKQFNIDVSLGSFFESPTIDSLIKVIKKDHKNYIHPPYPIISLLKDADIKLHISKKILKDKELYTHPKSILLTGATGFLGVHLLQDLITNTDAKIYCLIRADDISTAKNKLITKMKRYCLNENFSRIKIILGDLSCKQLSLTKQQYIILCKEIDVIYHCGALVHHMYDYQKLKPINVEGTVELIKLASSGKLKALHYISTSIIRINTIQKFEDYEKNLLYENINGGYEQSKFIAEKLIIAAAKQGISATIFRPSHILGSYKTGIFPVERYHMFMLLKGCIELGYAPNWNNKYYDMLSIDNVTNYIIENSLKHDSFGKSFPIISPKLLKWNDLILWLNNQGHHISMISSNLWKEKLKNIDENNALFPILSLYLGNSDNETQEDINDIIENNFGIDNQLMEKTFSYLNSIKFI